GPAESILRSEFQTPGAAPTSVLESEGEAPPSILQDGGEAGAADQPSRDPGAAAEETDGGN
ncbi:MAG: hypothetical protein M8858_02900, partial [marine benthic group bacterium]|nr:hypothetical protein [Gemmatimonadota bacterium]